MTILLRRDLAAGAVACLLLLGLGATSALAQDGNGALRDQIEQMKATMSQMQQTLDNLQQQEVRNEEKANAAAQAAAPGNAHAPPANAPRVTESANHRFGLSSADGQNTIELTGRLHLDAGDYFDTRSAFNSAASLDSGLNARRARIGVTGRFMGDWAYALIYDFGNTSDTVNINNYNAQNVHLQPAYQANSYAALSGLENAFITYNGFYSH